MLSRTHTIWVGGIIQPFLGKIVYQNQNQEQVYNQNSSFQPRKLSTYRRIKFQQTDASVKKIEVQLGQLADHVKCSEPGKFPSQLKQAQALTILQSGKESLFKTNYVVCVASYQEARSCSSNAEYEDEFNRFKDLKIVDDKPYKKNIKDLLKTHLEVNKRTKREIRSRGGSERMELAAARLLRQ
ncbi:hypothetical protein ACOSQ2_007245 [Xanthoceras sorbifolium]